MRTPTRISLVGCVALICAMWGIHGTVWASQKAKDKVPTITRMFTGADGLSHLEPMDTPVSQIIRVAAVQFNHSSQSNPNPRTLGFHKAPHRRYVAKRQPRTLSSEL